jgi:hypothetical protein
VEAKPDNSRESTASRSERERGDSLKRESKQPSGRKGGQGSGGKGCRERGKEAMADVLNGFLNRLNSMSGSSIAPNDIQQLKSHFSRQESSSAELDRILLANVDSFE